MRLPGLLVRQSNQSPNKVDLTWQIKFYKSDVRPGGAQGAKKIETLRGIVTNKMYICKYMATNMYTELYLFSISCTALFTIRIVPKQLYEECLANLQESRM